MKNKNIKRWIDRYRFAVDSQTIAPCSVSFAGSSITVLCPNEQTAAAVGALPNYGVTVVIKTK